MTQLIGEKKYIPPMGNHNAKIMILGEAPGWEEHQTGKPFVGPSGKELDKLLSEAGIKRDECWISNVFKYMIPPNPKKGKKIPAHVRAANEGINVTEQLEDLQKEINVIKPNVIVALGGTALWALKGTYEITNYRGSILHGMGRKIIPTFHPAHLLHSATGAEFKGYWNRFVMILDLKRAREESLSATLELPNRVLEICTSSHQLSEYIRQYKGYTRPAVDIEARGGHCIPNCIGLAFTPHHGMSVPLWHEGEIEGIARIPKVEIINMWILLAQVLYQDTIGHNFKYDEDKIKRFGFIIKRLVSDTMFKAFSINPELPKSLAFNQSIYTREPFYKNEGMYEGPLKDLLLGNARDACVTKELDIKMDIDLDELGQREWYENFVMHLHDLYLGIEGEGFYIDDQARRTLLEKYIRWSESLAYELYSLTGAYINVGSPKQVYTLLFEVLKLPRRDGTGEEELTALLNNQGKTGVHKQEDRRVVEIVLEKRRVDKAIDNNLMALSDYDGKMKTTYYPCLETGRSSTGQLDPPIRPLIEYRDEDNKKKKKAIGSAFQTFTKHGDIGADVRSMYVPRKGHVLMQADSSQAEARVVFRLANDEQALIDIDTRDYHALTASWFFGGTEYDYSKKVLGYEHPIRFAGKTLRHAGHLGAGKRRASISVNTDARKFKIFLDGKLLHITEGKAGEALEIFHKRQPKIQQVFQKGISDALANNKRFLTAGVPYGVNSKFGGKRQFFERWGDELFRQAYSYIPQRSVSDNTKNAALRMKRREPRAFELGIISVILESHDALVFSVLEKETQYFGPMIIEEMQRPIRFDTCSLPRKDLIIPCELEFGYNYQDLKKMKLILTPVEQEKIEIKEIETEIKKPLTLAERMAVIEGEP